LGVCTAAVSKADETDRQIVKTVTLSEPDTQHIILTTSHESVDDTSLRATSDDHQSVTIDRDATATLTSSDLRRK